MIKELDKITELDIQSELIRSISPVETAIKKDLIISNLRFSGSEMDVCRIMRDSRYIVEYEIKCSTADFRRDFMKNVETCKSLRLNKHEALKLGEAPANRFVFVTPLGLLSESDVPDYCGWAEITPLGVITRKKPPLLHTRKFDKWEWVATKLAYREMTNWKLG